MKKKVERFNFQAVRGSPFSNEDAEVIGPELLKIAEQNRVDDVRSLDSKLVYAAVEADPDHPLRRFVWFEDDDAAARAGRLARVGLLIRSVRIIYLTIRKREQPAPMFLYDPKHGTRPKSDVEPARRSHVLIDDALKDDPAFVSTLNGQIQLIRNAFKRLDHIANLRSVPVHVKAFLVAQRKAFKELDAATDSNEAAAAE